MASFNMGHSLSKFRNKNVSNVTVPFGPTHLGTEEKPQQETVTETTQLPNENQTSLQSNRDFHTNETSTYWLPKDDEEQLRLAGQHFAIKELYEGNILKSVEEKFDFEKGIDILDVGCGAGQWIMDMINDYPNCRYEGCDIVQVINNNLSPHQFNYSHGNILERLNYEDNTFDFVHCRLFILALREEEWPTAIKEAIRVTKPGGMIMLHEFDLRITGGGNPCVEKAMQGIHAACKARGQDPRIALKLEGFVNAEENAKVVQVDYRSIDMASNTSTAKKFVWDWKESLKSMLPKLGPIIGLNTEASQQKFLQDLAHALVTSEAYTYMNALAIEKTH